MNTAPPVFILALFDVLQSLTHATREVVTFPLQAATTTASTGTLIAAAYETFGYQTQHQILLQLDNLLQSVGGFIYLIALVSGIVTAAFLGRYRSMIWLLVGPPMFFFLVLRVVTGAGVAWEFGAFKDTRGDLPALLRHATVPDPSTSVSSFFHLYNLLISDTVQQGVLTVTDRNIRPQMMFLARQAVMDHIFGSLPPDASYLSLLAFFHAHCANEISDASVIALGQREAAKSVAPQAAAGLSIGSTGALVTSGFLGTPDYTAAVRRYCTNFPLRNKPFPPGPWWDQVLKMGMLPCSSPDGAFTLKDAQAGRRITCSVSCLDLWRWVVPAAIIANRTVVNFAVDKNIEPYARFTGHIVEDILKDVRQGITGGERAAAVLQEPCAMSGKAESTPGAQFESAEVERLARALLPNQVRRGLTGDPRSAIIQQAIAHSGITLQRWNTTAADNPARKDDIAGRYKAVELAQSQKYEAFWLMNTLPHLQGVILYVLAATYPFFALTVVLPGQAGAFLTWCALWAWAKSWDLGWALVMLTDEILWSLLPKSTYYHFEGATAASVGVWDTPVNVLEAAFGGDVSFTSGNYWTLVSLMVGSVPLLTAQAIMGSKKAMLGVLIDGLRNFGSRLGGSAADWEAHRNVERNDVEMNLDVINSVRKEGKGWLERARELKRTEGTYNQLKELHAGAVGAWALILAENADTTLGGGALAAGNWIYENGGALLAWFGVIERAPVRMDLRKMAIENQAAVVRSLQADLDKQAVVTVQAFNRLKADVTATFAKLIAVLDHSVLPQSLTPQGPELKGLGGRALSRLVDREKLIADSLHELLGTSLDDAYGRNSLDVKETKALTLEMERQKQIAGWYDLGAWGSAGVGIALGYVGAKTKNPFAVAGSVAALNFAYQLNAGSLNIHRNVNASMRTVVEINHEVWFANAMRSQSVYFRQEMRAAISNRGEWWNVPELPVAAVANAQNAAAALRTENEAVHGRVTGEFLWGIVGTVSKGKAVGAAS